MEMKAGDLVMLIGDAVLYDPRRLDSDPIFGKIGEFVTVIKVPDEFGVATVLHPSLGLCDIHDHCIHPIAGGPSES